MHYSIGRVVVHYGRAINDIVVTRLYTDLSVKVLVATRLTFGDDIAGMRAHISELNKIVPVQPRC